MKRSSEALLQSRIVAAIHLLAVDRSIPSQQREALLCIHHIPNGATNLRRGAREKRMGVLAGMPDLCLPLRTSSYGALYLEVKTPKGRVSPHQAEVHEELTRAGNCVAVVRSVSEAIETIKRYLLT